MSDAISSMTENIRLSKRKPLLVYLLIKLIRIVTLELLSMSLAVDEPLITFASFCCFIYLFTRSKLIQIKRNEH